MKGILRIPDAPHSIKKGSSLKPLLSSEAIECLGSNLSAVYPAFDGRGFGREALRGIRPLGIIQRGHHIAAALKRYLPKRYETAIQVLIGSLTEPLFSTDRFGLSGFFYLPHVCFVANYGLDA
jgi:hypothetical protein